MSTITMQQMLESGVHFGHQTRRWNPKMKPYIYTARGGIHILDLEKTAHAMNRALTFLKKEVQNGKTVLFVSTKQQTKDLLPQIADDCNMPYITERWLGGFLTNFKTISKRMKHLRTLEDQKKSGEWTKKYTKKESLMKAREIIELNRIFAGSKNLSSLPDILFVVDICRDLIAIREAKRMNIPIIALADTNANPALVDYPIPANDDGHKALELLLSIVSSVIKENAPKHTPAKVKGTVQPVGEVTEEVIAEKEGKKKKPKKAPSAKKKPAAKKKTKPAAKKSS